MKYNFFLSSLICCFLLACNEGPDTSLAEEPPGPKISIDLTISQCDVSEDPTCEFRSPAINALIEIYASERDQEDRDILIDNFSGIDGKARFNDLEPGVYYITVFFQDLEEMLIINANPTAEVSFEEVIFPI